MATCLLSACGTRNDLTPSVELLPPSLSAPCDDPVYVPERDITRTETVLLWTQDRRALTACRARHGGLVAALSGPQ